METRSDKIPRWFATRWAGAACAALYCGADFDKVWVEAQPVLSGGLACLQPGASEIPSRLDVTPEDAAAIIAIAGPMAEARARGWRLQDVDRKDPHAMDAFRERLAGGALEARISALSAAMFNAPRMWTGVNAIAGALQARRILPFYEVVSIVDRLERDATP